MLINTHLCSFATQDCRNVSEVIFTLLVARLDVVESEEQLLIFKTINTSVDFVNRQLFIVGIFLLDNP